MLSTCFRAVVALTINKIVSIYAGPSGLAMVGQLQNFVQVCASLSSGGINSGVVKMTARQSLDDQSLNEIWSNAFFIVIISSLISLLLIFSFSSQLSSFLFDSKLDSLLRWFSFLIIMIGMNQILLCVLNGLGAIRKYVTLNVIQSIFQLIYVIILANFFDFEGVLFSIISVQAFSVLFIIFSVKNQILKRINFSLIKKSTLNKLFSFSFITLSSAIMAPLSFFFIRNLISNELSQDYSGYWQALNQISKMYMLVIGSALSLYFLPKLSSTTSKREVLREIKAGYKFFMPIVFASSLIVILFSDFIIKLIYSNDFIWLSNIIHYQMIGDFFQVYSYMLAIFLISKSMTLYYIIAELSYRLLSILIYKFSIIFFGESGIAIGHLATYIFYSIILSAIFIKYLRDKNVKS